MSDNQHPGDLSEAEEAAQSDDTVSGDGGYNATDDAWVRAEPSPDAQRIARAFHDRYETLAPTFGYRTQDATSVAWDNVPPKNKALMVATVQQLLSEGTILP